jgi:hypothetical protein
MTQTVFDDQKALEAIEAQLERARALAKAEAAFEATNSPAIPNPWAGSQKTLADLEADRQQLQLRVAGAKLNDLLAKRDELQKRYDDLTLQKIAADRQVAELAQNPTVIRYREASFVTMREGWGRSFQIFREFFESKRAIYNAAPDCAPWFLNSQEAENANVRFNLEADRQAVHLWIQATDEANKILSAWNSASEQLRNLLREHPELGAAS